MNSILNTGAGRPPRRSRTRLQRVEYILLAAGFLCLGVYLYSLVESGFWQNYDEYRLEATMRGAKPSPLGYVWHLVTGGGVSKTTEDENAYTDLPGKLPRIYRTPPPYGIIGRIEVPRLKVSAVVREGVDSKTLRRSAGHVPGTPLPGDEGNVALAAHRDTFFRGLRNVREQDRIRMVTPEGTFEYVVRSTQIVKPTDVEVLDSKNGKRELTLITCYPFNYVGHAPSRFIVRAEQLSAEPAPPARSTTAAVTPSAAVLAAVATEPVVKSRTQSSQRRVSAHKARKHKARPRARR
jgi:sortase A